jgi:hypothetical protein
VSHVSNWIDLEAFLDPCNKIDLEVVKQTKWMNNAFNGCFSF